MGPFFSFILSPIPLHLSTNDIRFVRIELKIFLILTWAQPCKTRCEVMQHMDLLIFIFSSRCLLLLAFVQLQQHKPKQQPFVKARRTKYSISYPLTHFHISINRVVKSIFIEWTKWNRYWFIKRPLPLFHCYIPKLLNSVCWTIMRVQLTWIDN